MDELRLVTLLRESLSHTRRNVNFGLDLFREDFAEVCEIIEKRYRMLLNAERKSRVREEKR